MRQLRNGLVVACLVVSMLPAHAVGETTPTPISARQGWQHVGGDQVVSAAEGTVSASFSGPGFNLFRSTGLLYGYTFRLVASPRVEVLRGDVERVAADVRSITGIPMSVGAGTIADRDPGRGEILISVSDTSDCDPRPWGPGCGGPVIGLGGRRPGVDYILGGRVWIRPSTVDFTAYERRHVVFHEIGHALGLMHFDDAYEGRYQVMHWSNFDWDHFQSGDRGGLIWQRNFGAAFAPPARRLDFDGDLDSDAASHSARDGSWRVGVSRWLSDQAAGSGWNVLPGDFNGDGREDIAAHDPGGTWYVGLNTGTSFTTMYPWLTGQAAGEGWEVFAGDFNGDGMDDIGAHYRPDGSWWIGHNTGSNSFTLMYLWLAAQAAGDLWQVFPGDFNGDGRDDIAGYHPAGGSWYVGLNTGTSFTTMYPWLTGNAAGGGWRVFPGDFNADGLDDIGGYHPGEGSWWVGLNSGTGSFGDMGRWLTGQAAGTGWQVLPGDFNADGLDDIGAFRPSEGSWWVGINSGTRSFALMYPWFTDPAGVGNDALGATWNPIRSSFKTTDGELKVGLNEPRLGPLAVVEGAVRDPAWAVSGVLVTFSSPLFGATDAAASLSCNSTRTTCTWQVAVPVLIPGTYTVTATATDAAGNIERRPSPTISIQVI